MINMTKLRVMGGQSGHLDCLKYLHETAKAPWRLFGRTRSAHEQPPRMFTIPPRQRLSSPTGWRYEGGTVTHVLNTCSDTQRERDNERER